MELLFSVAVVQEVVVGSLGQCSLLLYREFWSGLALPFRIATLRITIPVSLHKLPRTEQFGIDWSAWSRWRDSSLLCHQILEIHL